MADHGPSVGRADKQLRSLRNPLFSSVSSSDEASLPGIRSRSHVLNKDRCSTILATGLLALGLIASAVWALHATAARASEFEFSTQKEMSEFVRQDCGACHGLSLKGGLGKPLLKESLEHFDLETIEMVILDGIPDTAMPPWRGLLSEEQVKWIAKSLKEGTIE